jgi:hypothetical protein
VPPYIYADIGGADRWIWFILANLLSLVRWFDPQYDETELTVM